MSPDMVFVLLTCVSTIAACVSLVFWNRVHKRDSNENMIRIGMLVSFFSAAVIILAFYLITKDAHLIGRLAFLAPVVILLGGPACIGLVTLILMIGSFLSSPIISRLISKK